MNFEGVTEVEKILKKVFLVKNGGKRYICIPEKFDTKFYTTKYPCEFNSTLKYIQKVISHSKPVSGLKISDTNKTQIWYCEFNR